MQGYYFSRPVAPELFEQMARQGRHLDSVSATLAA
jgi:EAL domain-containing protein (putative c-di-GMP-specific phosphodiesterase class I)